MSTYCCEDLPSLRDSRAVFSVVKDSTIKAPSQRQLRVSEAIRHILAMLIGKVDFRDPSLACVKLTITEVRVSSDLRNATIFIVPLGGGDPASMLIGLRRVRSFLRHELACRMRLQFVPELLFKADTRFDEASHIEEILRRPDVQRDLHMSEGNYIRKT